MPTSNHSELVAEVLGGLVLGIDHIAIAVRDLDGAAKTWSRLLGLPAVDHEEVTAQQTMVAFVRMPAHSSEQPAAVELLSPMKGNAGLTKFLDKRGEGLHHIAFAVSDIREAIARLKAAGVRLIDEAPRPGACGHLVAFIHPKSMNGTLIELVESARK
jgi:methylmalonyl-CoA/ethylmalonyl-CoA epimerase